MAKSRLGRKGFIWFSLPSQVREAESLEECCLLSCSACLQSHLPRSGTFPSGMGFPTLIIIQKMLYRLAYWPMWWRHFLHWDDFSLCQVNRKLGRTSALSGDQSKENSSQGFGFWFFFCYCYLLSLAFCCCCFVFIRACFPVLGRGPWVSQWRRQALILQFYHHL